MCKTNTLPAVKKNCTGIIFIKILNKNVPINLLGVYFIVLEKQFKEMSRNSVGSSCWSKLTNVEQYQLKREELM